MQDRQEWIDDIDEAQKYIEALQASQSIVWKHVQILSNFLTKVEAWEIAWLSSEDAEFLPLKEKLDRKIIELENLKGDRTLLSHVQDNALEDVGIEAYKEVIDTSIENREKWEFFSRLESVTIESLQEGEANSIITEFGEVYISQWQAELAEQIRFETPDAKTQGFIEKIAQIQSIFEMESSSKNGERSGEVIEFYNKIKDIEEPLTLESAKGIVEEFGFWLIRSWIDEKQEFLQSDPQFSNHIAWHIQQAKEILRLADNRDFEDMQELVTMKREDFFTRYDHTQRLRYVTREAIDPTSLEVDTEMEFQFHFLWELNTDLERLSAGDVLPDTVEAVTKGDKTYTRRGPLGDFVEDTSDGSLWARLTLLDGETLTIKTLRTDDALSSIYAGIDETLQESGLNGAELDVARQALNTWQDIPPAEVTQALVEYARSWGNIEKELNNMFDVFGVIAESLWENSLVGKLLKGFIDMLSSSDLLADEGEWWLGTHSFEWFWNYGPVWDQLASFLITHRPVYNGQPYYCGQNVWEALNHFGIEGLPQSGRHGHKWADICRSRPNQFQKWEWRAEDAPAWAVISYHKNTWWSQERQEHGHVEIALGNGQFYFGQINNHPGGSNTSPQPWEYEIYISIAKKVDGSDRDLWFADAEGINTDSLHPHRKAIVDAALTSYNQRDICDAEHCTDWVDKIYARAVLNSVHNKPQKFNSVSEVSPTGSGDTWLRPGDEGYAGNDVINTLEPGDHIMVDHGPNYGRWRTHSAIILEAPVDGIARVVSYPNHGRPPQIERYDLTWQGRWGARPEKILRVHSAV